MPLYRNWTCSCGHKYKRAIRLSPVTINLSGEATQWCPNCQRKPMMGSAAYKQEEEEEEKRKK
jgi:hypothetical protein